MFTIPADATVREILEAIDQWADTLPIEYGYDRATQPAFQMWNILAALRGPDSGAGTLKHFTTAIIRQTVLPKLANRVGVDINGNKGIDGMPTEAYSDKTQAYIQSGGMHYENNHSHFMWHIEMAKEAIVRLYPESLNTPEGAVKEYDPWEDRLDRDDEPEEDTWYDDDDEDEPGDSYDDDEDDTASDLEDDRL